MARHISSIEELIEALGGTSAVARFCEYESDSGVSNWKARGFIPPAWHLRLLLELSKRGCTVAPSVFGLPDEEFTALVARRREPDRTAQVTAA